MERSAIVSEGEYRLIQLMAEKGFREGTLDEASKYLGLDKSTIASLVELLKEKGLVLVSESVHTRHSLTERGLRVLEEGLPEERLIVFLGSRGGEAPLRDVSRELGGEASVAIGQAKVKGLVEVEGGSVRLRLPQDQALLSVRGIKEALEAIRRGEGVAEESLVSELVRRGFAKPVEEKLVRVRPVEDPGKLLAKLRVEASRLTSRMLREGLWRRVSFKEYNVKAEPPKVLPARKHYLAEFIEMLRDVMKEMGFEESTGPLIEVEFFNFDLLFQAQDHPAREIHDTLRVKKPHRVSLLEYLDIARRVARVHSRGWGYEWSMEVAERTVLRSQTTSVSVRVLLKRPKPPIRFFSLGKVFRSDAVSATRLPEFHQIDGIEGYHDYTFRDLLGTLTELSERLGLKVKFKPAYFPFTEPSIEGYARLPNGSWLELFGAGMFRPEVLEMLGVDYQVGAWGMGIERLALAYYGLSDIRQLYTKDVSFIAGFRAPRVW